MPYGLHYHLVLPGKDLLGRWLFASVQFGDDLEENVGDGIAEIIEHHYAKHTANGSDDERLKIVEPDIEGRDRCGKKLGST